MYSDVTINLRKRRHHASEYLNWDNTLVITGLLITDILLFFFFLGGLGFIFFAFFSKTQICPKDDSVQNMKKDFEAGVHPVPRVMYILNKLNISRQS